ncbi:MAG: hypothetical protein GX591_16980 [Planctomycetes bacterium]|nr:hypothetical protein [Planctomycetota bacterium]
MNYAILSHDSPDKRGCAGQQFSASLDGTLTSNAGVGGTVWLDCSRLDDIGQDTGRGNGDMNEVSCTLYGRYLLEDLCTLAKAGWIAQTFPQESGDAAFTQSWFLLLAFDDGRWFGTDAPLLNPYVAYYQDLDNFHGGWLEAEISHCFALAGLGMEEVPLLKDITVTPSCLLSVDFGQLEDDRGPAALEYGIVVDYDLTAAADLPVADGRLYLSAFLYFRQTFADELEDVLYGGLSMTLSW